MRRRGHKSRPQKRKTYRRAFKRKSRRPRTGPTSMRFRASGKQHQPMPDRFFTTLQVDQICHVPGSTAATGNYAFSLNMPQYPFNRNGSASGVQTVPNPQAAIGSQCPAGFSNLLANTGTNTGIYDYFRVWGAKVDVDFNTQALGDASQVCLTAINSTNSKYAGITTATAGPNSISKAITSSRGSARLSKYFSLPRIQGLSKSAYGSFSTLNFGSWNNAPGNEILAHILWATQDGNDNAAAIGLTVKVKYYVEFFGRVDIGLLDT